MSVGNTGTTGYAAGMGAQAYPASSYSPAATASAAAASGGAAPAGSLSNSQLSPADSALYTTITGAPAPSASSVAMLPPPIQAAAGNLMSAPSSYYPAQPLVNESNGQLAMTGAAAAQAPHTASRVFYATLAVYGAFLTGVAGLLTIPATLRSRGREAKFSFNAAKDSDNEKYRSEQKQKAFEEASRTIKRAKQSKERPLSTSAAQAGLKLARSANDPAFDAKTAGIPRIDSARDFHGVTSSTVAVPAKLTKTEIPANFDPVEHFIAPDAPEVIQHNGWWSKLLARKSGAGTDSALIGEEYLGYFAKGGTFNGVPVTAEHGEAFFSSPEMLKPGSPIFEKLHRAGFTESGHVIAAADLRHHEHRVLPVFSRALPATPSARNAILGKLGLSPDSQRDLLTALRNNKRLDKSQTQVLSANTWDNQYELVRGTRHVLSSSVALKKAGQVRQRVTEFGSAAKKAFLNPVEAGNRMGLMLMSSTLLNALLVATAAVVSLGMVHHPQPKPAPTQDDSQNQ